MKTTTQCLRQILFAALSLMVWFSPAWAQKRVALVIGNSDYAVESKLVNPVNDARLIASTLKSQGFTVEVKTDLPKRDMELAIAAFVRQSTGADSAVLYYAGHGVQPAIGGRNFLLPVDAKVESDDTLAIDGIAAERIVEQLERSDNPARIRLVVLDACRKNRLAGKTRSGVRGLARMSPGDDFTLIAFSTNEQDVAQDGSSGNSPYALALSKYLAQSNELPLRRIFELTATDVRSATNQKQKPRTFGDLDSRLLLRGAQVASIKPEPVRSTTQPGQSSGMSLEDLEKEDAVRKQWAQWQAKMKVDYDKAAAFKGSADLQVKAWERFLATWSQDNPLSQEDEALRKQAKNQLSQKVGHAGDSLVTVPMPSASPPIATQSSSGGVTLAAVKENRGSDKRLTPQDGCDQFFDAGYIYEGDFGKEISHRLINSGSTELDIYQDEQQSPSVDVKFPSVATYTVPEFQYSPELFANCGGTWCIGKDSGRKFAAINSMQELKWIETAPKKHLTVVRVNRNLINDGNRDLIRDKFFVIKYKTLGRFFSTENTLKGDFKNTACQHIGVHFCGDGLLDRGKEVCDPADLNKVNWGSGGCSAKCQPQ